MSQALASIGLVTQDSRFFAAAVVSAGLLYVFKPMFAFTPNGETRPWIWDCPSSPKATPFHFVPVSLGLAFLFSRIV
jgi:hypothetical protein